MPDARPVVVYGASGYTGRLVCEYLRELNVPFTAAGRSKDRVHEVLSRVPGIDTVDYDVVEVEHEVGALTDLFRGARVVSNMVGPFIRYGDPVVEAGQQETAIALPWGGTSHPVWFKNDPRVATCRAAGGVFDRAVMEGVVAITKVVEEQIKTLPADQQGPALAEIAAQMQAGMP